MTSRRLMLWAADATAYVVVPLAIGVVVYMVFADSPHATNYAAISIAWCAFFVAYVLAISIRAGLQLTPLLFVTDLFFASKEMSVGTASGEWAALLQLSLFRTAFYISPILVAAVTRIVLVRLRIVGAAGIRHKRDGESIEGPN